MPSQHSTVSTAPTDADTIRRVRFTPLELIALGVAAVLIGAALI
ncbi:MAG: hypothetical protein U0R66_04785 [Mycobacterium sp.]